MTAVGELDEAAERRPRTVLWVAAGVGAVLVVLIAVLATRPSFEGRSPGSQLLGRPVPAVAGPTTAGAAFDIDAERGRWVVVNFFAEWCPPCLEEHPELVRFAERHAAAGDATLVSVPFQTTPEKVTQFFAENGGGDWPVLAADSAAGRLALDFGVTGLPETFLVDPGGIVVWRTEGTVTADLLDQAIATASGQGATGQGAG